MMFFLRPFLGSHIFPFQPRAYALTGFEFLIFRLSGAAMPVRLGEVWLCKM